MNRIYWIHFVQMLNHLSGRPVDMILYECIPSWIWTSECSSFSLPLFLPIISMIRENFQENFLPYFKHDMANSQRKKTYNRAATEWHRITFLLGEILIQTYTRINMKKSNLLYSILSLKNKSFSPWRKLPFNYRHIPHLCAQFHYTLFLYFLSHSFKVHTR